MKGFVGLTNNDWFVFLAQQPGIDEVNLWQPSAEVSFRARHSATRNGGQVRHKQVKCLFAK